MQSKSIKTERRRHDRKQAILPVRVRGIDAAGASFDELAHTLDLAPTGARLGSIRRSLKNLDTLVVFYRQRRMEFRVIWSKLLDGKCEHQVGLQAMAQVREPWGLNVFDSNPGKESHAASGAA
jgi:hypothetical protein